MRLSKPLCLVLSIILMFFFCSCGFFGDQKYECDVDTVSSAQIVRLDRYVQGEYRYEYTVIYEANDYHMFVSQLNQLKHSVNWGDPGLLKEGYVVIKIDYLNGDYDLLYKNAQWFHRAGVNQNGYFFFDEDQFSEFVLRYIESQN